MGTPFVLAQFRANSHFFLNGNGYILKYYSLYLVPV